MAGLTTLYGKDQTVAGLTALTGEEPRTRPWSSWPRSPGDDQTLPA